MSTIAREHVTHNLKIWPEYFSAVRDGLKRAELRWNDREYQAGDTLDLCEWDPNEEAFTGDFISVTVTHVAELGQWMPGYVLLSIAPPAPVSMKDHQVRELVNELRDIAIEYQGTQQLRERIARAIRAAMLQGAVQPQNQQQNIPENIPANTPCKEAPEHIWLQTAGVWPENGEFSELTWCSDNQHEDDTLYVRADVVAGNSPTIPDGWKLVPVDPTKDMLRAGQSVVGFWLNTVHCYSKMLAAAPQQEAKNV